MTSSSRRSDLDLARGVPTTPEDIEALRRIRGARKLSTEQYLRVLSGLQAPALEVLKARKRGRGGEPFRLTEP